jgi:hypothetical protein
MLVLRKMEPIDWVECSRPVRVIPAMKHARKSMLSAHVAPAVAVATPAGGSGSDGFPPRRTVYLLLLLLCLAPYRGVLNNWLFNDDFSWLREARYDMRPGNILTLRVVDFFRPVVNLSFYLTEKVAPGNVPLDYAFNLALHFVCALLAFHLIDNLLKNREVAACAAALFAVTSVHSAAVLWISARTTLLSSFFLLASLAVLTSSKGTAIVRVAASVALYILALASKEEAISGLLLLGLLAVLWRGADGRAESAGEQAIRRASIPPPAARESRGIGGTRALPSRSALVAFAGVTVVYLLVRHTIIGGMFRQNWGLGAHWIRNLAGGFLYQLYPWPFFSLFYPRGTYLPEPASAIMPEILALPLIAILLWAGYAARRAFAMNFAVGWALISLLPASLFRYRFFSTASISQDRYYYLSSLGTMLCIALLLSMLWTRGSRARRAAAIGIFVLLCAGSVLRDGRLERKWGDFTRMYREIVTSIVDESAAFSGTKTLAVEGSPLAFPYLADAIALEMPGWRAVELTGGRTEAERYAPCLYVSFTGTVPKVMRMEKIDGLPKETGEATNGAGERESGLPPRAKAEEQ